MIPFSSGFRIPFFRTCLATRQLDQRRKVESKPWQMWISHSCQWGPQWCSCVCVWSLCFDSSVWRVFVFGFLEGFLWIFEALKAAKHVFFPQEGGFHLSENLPLIIRPNSYNNPWQFWAQRQWEVGTKFRTLTVPRGVVKATTDETGFVPCGSCGLLLTHLMTIYDNLWSSEVSSVCIIRNKTASNSL